MLFLRKILSAANRNTHYLSYLIPSHQAKARGEIQRDFSFNTRKVMVFEDIPELLNMSAEDYHQESYFWGFQTPKNIEEKGGRVSQKLMASLKKRLPRQTYESLIIYIDVSIMNPGQYPGTPNHGWHVDNFDYFPDSYRYLAISGEPEPSFIKIRNLEITFRKKLSRVPGLKQTEPLDRFIENLQAHNEDILNQIIQYKISPQYFGQLPAGKLIRYSNHEIHRANQACRPGVRYFFLAYSDLGNYHETPWNDEVVNKILSSRNNQLRSPIPLYQIKTALEKYHDTILIP